MDRGEFFVIDDTKNVSKMSIARICRRAVSGARCRSLRSLSQYGIVGKDEISKFEEMMDEGGVVKDQFALEAYNRDWTGQYVGTSSVALRPKTTEEVSKVLRFCNDRRIPIVPQGGNTGLVGGGVPVKDEVVLSLERMNRILEVDEEEGVAVTEAGCVLETLEKIVGGKGFTVPVDLGAKGSCQMGGLVSTNAGGARFIRFGPLRGSVTGLEVVLADGTVVSSLQKMKKNNTGIDLQQLFIGSEGTLGVITKVAVKLARRPASINAVFLKMGAFDQVVSVLNLAKNHLAEILSAAEYLDQGCMEVVKAQLPTVEYPFHSCKDSEEESSRSEKGHFYVLIETWGSNEEHDFAKLEHFLEELYQADLVSEGVLAQGVEQTSKLWHIREGIPEALRKIGTVLKYDVSLPLTSMDLIVKQTRQSVKGHQDISVYGFGHLGDGNTHLNVVVHKENNVSCTKRDVDQFVYNFVIANGGSISAEHGIGQLKLPILMLAKDKHLLHLAAQIKNTIDPRLILNPHKAIPLGDFEDEEQNA